MASRPKVSVITATWQRPGLLIKRCIPSVAAQTYSAVEHIVVSDGPDERLKSWLWNLAGHGLPGPDDLIVDWLPEHGAEPHWGAEARNRGLELASGELIAYLDDDDAFRPFHVEHLVLALQAHPEAGFAYSAMVCHNPSGELRVGGPEPVCGGIGTPMLMHRRSVLDIARWGAPDCFEDWNMISQWLDAGVKYTFTDVVTADVWYSMYAQVTDPMRAVELGAGGGLGSVRG